ncbi:MAG: HlyD family efflux transporter periplasmic adaptor subunit [Planctomycetaceae bacterium]
MRRVLVFLMIGIVQPAFAQNSTTAIPARGCFLRLKDEAQVPALEQGVLQEFQKEPGDRVAEGDLLTSLEDTEAKLLLKLAEMDLEVAAKRHSQSVSVEIAGAAVDESASLLQQAKIDLSVSRKMAESDIVLRQSLAATAYSQEAFDRALKSKQEFATSVSELELARLRFELDKSRMDSEQARYDQSLQLLRSTGQAAMVEQHETAAKRLALELTDAKTEHAVAGLTVERMQKAVEVAREKLARRRITSPLTGIVVEKLKHTGEWVEAGEPVLRVIRLDRLLVEGYVEANLVDQSDRGHRVEVRAETRQGTVTVEGRVVFVSPEIDSVNRQVQVRAEIENGRLLLRPGQPVDMIILAE